MSRPDIIDANPLRGSSMLRSSEMVLRNAWTWSSSGEAGFAPSCCAARGRRPGGARHGRYPAGLSGAVWLTTWASFSQIHRILHTGVEALSTHRVMHMCRVAGQQHPSFAVGRSLPSHVGEPGYPGGTVDPVIGTPDGDERLAEIAQGGFGRGAEVLLGHPDPHRSPVLQPAEGVDAEGVAVDAPFRLLGQLDLGDQGARGRIPPGELDAGCLPDQTASSVAPDEILRPQPLPVGQLDVHAGVVLREARHLTSAIDRHRQFADPAGQDALDVVLPQPEPVVVPGGKVADVQSGAGES